jgi:hypothetical protein
MGKKSSLWFFRTYQLYCLLSVYHFHDLFLNQRSSDLAFPLESVIYFVRLPPSCHFGVGFEVPGMVELAVIYKAAFSPFDYSSVRLAKHLIQ